jgi:hypothetical protein
MKNIVKKLLMSLSMIMKLKILKAQIENTKEI